MITPTSESGNSFGDLGQLVADVIPLDRLSVTLIARPGKQPTPVYEFGTSLAGIPPGTLPRVRGELAELMAKAPTPRILDSGFQGAAGDIAIASDYARKAGLNSWMAAPIVWAGRVIGIIHFRSKSKKAFGKPELLIAGQIAGQIAGAVATLIAYEKVEREASEREALATIGRIITSARTLEEIFDQFSGIVNQLVPTDRLAITLVEPGGDLPIRLLSHGIDLPELEPGQLPPTQGQISALLRKTRKPIVLQATHLDSPDDVPITANLAKLAGLNSWMAAPIFFRNQLIGNIHFRSVLPDAYGEYEVDLAAQITAQIAGSIAGILAYEEQVRRTEERDAIATIGRIVSSAQSLGVTFEMFAQKVVELIPFDRISVFLFLEAGGPAVPALEYGRALVDTEHQQLPVLTGDLDELVTATRKPMVLRRDMPDTPQDVLTLESLAEKVGLRSWLVAPMLWREQLIGNIHFRSDKRNAYGEREIRLAGEITAQIAGSIAGNIAFGQQANEATVRDVLAKISQVISSTNNFVAVLPTIQNIISTVVKFDGFSIAAYNRETEFFRVLHSSGAGVDEKILESDFPAADSIATDVIKSGEIAVETISSVQQLKYRPRSAIAFREGARTFLSVPLVTEDHAAGILQLRSKTANAYSLRDIDIVGRIGEQIAGGLANFLVNEQVRIQAAALEATDHGIVITTPEGIIEWVNPAFTTLTGWTAAEAIGQHTSIMRSADPEQIPLNDRIWSTISRGESWRGVHINRRKDGSEYPEQITVTPVFGQNNQMEHFIGIKQDITDRIRMDEQREDANRIESENRELQRLADARSEFLSTVSHELRTPLTIVSAFADILFNINSINLTEYQRANVDRIRKSSTQLARLIGDLLDVSQADTGRLVLDKQEFDPAAMVLETVDQVRVLLDQREQPLEVTNITDGITLLADRSRVVQVLSNLLTNASKYSDTGAKIKLEVSTTNDHIEFRITDEGPGIAETDQVLIFSPFYRVSKDMTSDTVGSGLGLSVVKSIVDLHDGVIKLNSEVGKGTSITVSLPGVTSASPTSDQKVAASSVRRP
ncbi:MAG: GAF domain-containing protein [Chloroflexi bacterium]|nr:GAF domain-containing protein [Chloroflexota bacterium]